MGGTLAFELNLRHTFCAGAATDRELLLDLSLDILGSFMDSCRQVRNGGEKADTVITGLIKAKHRRIIIWYLSGALHPS